MQSTSTQPEQWDLILRHKRGIIPVDFPELWRYRELLFFLVWRNILIRYKQTAVGVLWAVFRPVVGMVIFTVIFGRLAKLPSKDAPYAIMTLAAILPWQFFSTALTRGSMAVVAAQNVVQKVYFPRLYIPISQVLASLVDSAISLVILFGMMVWYDVPFRVELLLLPVFMAVAVLASIGVTTLFGAMNVKYRDIQHIIPFLVRIGAYISPVGFMSSIIPERWRLIYSLNPAVAVIDGFRWAILGDEFLPYWPGFLASMGVVALLFIVGLYYFRYTERTFADVI